MREDVYALHQRLRMPEPARVISRTRLGMQLSMFYSQKCDQIFRVESSIELDYAHFLEWSKEVQLYLPQPISVTYVQRGKRSLYTPDFFHVTTQYANVITEIKPKGWDESPFYREKFELIAHCLANEGKQFQVVTDADLRKGCLIANLRYLYPFFRTSSPSDLLAVVLALRKAGGQARVKALLDDNPDLQFSALAAFAYENWAQIEDFPFDYDSVLTLED